MKKIAREDWFTAGLDLLNTRGFLHITIENLCEALGVTKGSFYHHFKHADAYVEALMAYWEEHNTRSVIRQADLGDTAQIQMERLIGTILGRSHKSEQVIRGWSFANDTVRKCVQRVDELRLRYTTDLKIRCGEDQTAASNSALLEYACLVGIQQLYPDLTAEKQYALYRRLNLSNQPTER